MKKVSIVLILIFTFSLISFAEELKMKITNDNSTLNIYDDSVNFTHKYHDQ